nr:DUF192 domain-containing protein [Hyella patelloides]
MKSKLMLTKNITIKKENNHKNFYTILFLIWLLCSSCGMIVSQDSLQIAQAKETTTQDRNQGQVLPITAQALIEEETIDLEVAQTPEQQAMGLMFRDALPDNRGMFFPLGEARIARFWMNNVPVALDMIFIKEGQIMAIAGSVPPCTTKPEDCPLYGPDTVVDGVIELRAGRAKELGLAAGDFIEIKYLDTLQQN